MLEVLEQERRELLLGLVDGTVVPVRVPHVQDFGHQRLERLADGGDPVDRERAHRRAVVGDVARDRLPSPPGTGRDGACLVDTRRRLAGRNECGARALLAARGVVLPCQLPRGLDGLGAAGDEEDTVEVARRDRRDLGRELDRARVRVTPVRVERQLAHLRGRRLADLLAVAVTDVDGEQSRQRVEIPLAVRVLEVAAVATDDDRHLGIPIAGHPREVQPQVLARRALQVERGRCRRGHSSSSCTRVPQS